MGVGGAWSFLLLGRGRVLLCCLNLLFCLGECMLFFLFVLFFCFLFRRRCVFCFCCLGRARLGCLKSEGDQERRPRPNSQKKYAPAHKQTSAQVAKKPKRHPPKQPKCKTRPLPHPPPDTLYPPPHAKTRFEIKFEYARRKSSIWCQNIRKLHAGDFTFQARFQDNPREKSI